MEELRLSSTIQAKCCSALRYLVIDDNQMLSEAEGIDSIMKALYQHQKVLNDQLEGLRLLENLSWDARITRDIVEAGGLIALNDAMGFFPS